MLLNFRSVFVQVLQMSHRQFDLQNSDRGIAHLHRK